jgi:hypothetical protein
MPTRREALLLPGALWAAPAARVESIEVISQQPELYHGWPSMIRRANGELVVVFSGGRESHVCPFGRLEMMISRDDGRTWSWPQVLMDSPIDDRDAGILETPRGTLLATTFTSLAYESRLDKQEGWPEDRLRRWQAVNRRAGAEQRRSLLGCWMLRSEDGGLTWSAPFRVPVDSPHGPISLSSGRLLYAGKQLWEPEARNGAAESTDDGRTWRWLSAIPTRPGDRPQDYHELHAVETASGRVIVQIRNHNTANRGETLQCESGDGGSTWSVPHAIGVWGLPSHLLRLRDGRLLMSYGHRRPPYGNQARVSNDGGGSWSGPITISADGAGGDLGYPASVELADGRLLTVWYERLKTSPMAVLRMARWVLED